VFWLAHNSQPHGRHFALYSDAMHATLSQSGLYAQQKSVGATAGTKACCFLVLPNSSQPQGRHFALHRDAVHDTLTQSGLYAK